jgi:hypothetical protein
MPFAKGGPNPSFDQRKQVFRKAANNKNHKNIKKVLLVLRKSNSEEFGDGWGLYTPARRGIIIKKGDIATSHIGFQSCRGSKETSTTHSAPTGGNYGISDGKMIRDAIIASIPPGVSEVEFTASTEIHLQNVISSLSPLRTGPFVVTWNSLGVFCNSSWENSSTSNVTKPLPWRAAYVSAINLQLTTRQARVVARQEKKKIKERVVGEDDVVNKQQQQQRFSKRLIISKKGDDKTTAATTTATKCDLQDFVIVMPMLAARDVRGNEQLLWDYPWR